MDEDPVIGMLWEEYSLCRSEQFVHFIVKTGSGNNQKEKPISFTWPQVIMNWPEGGSLRDQSYMVIKVFSAFREGEKEGTLRRVNKLSHSGSE